MTNAKEVDDKRQSVITKETTNVTLEEQMISLSIRW